MAFSKAQPATLAEPAPYTTPQPREQYAGDIMNKIWNVQNSSQSPPVDTVSLSSHGSIQFDGIPSSTSGSLHTSSSSRASTSSNFDSLPATTGFMNYSFERNMPNDYGYYLDRGNGQFTRLIPADMLPPMKGVPAREEEHDGMVILQPIEKLQLQNKIEANQQYAPKKKQQSSPLPDNLQNQIDCIVATSPKSTRKVKIYCDKWIHEGVCAFTQQGCKFKHEMPQDEATQRSLGLFHGFPTWWKKRAEEQNSLRRSHDVPTQPVSPPHLGPATPYQNSEVFRGRNHHPVASEEQRRMLPRDSSYAQSGFTPGPNNWRASGSQWMQNGIVPFLLPEALRFNVGQLLDLATPPNAHLGHLINQLGGPLEYGTLLDRIPPSLQLLIELYWCREATLTGGQLALCRHPTIVTMDAALAMLNSLADYDARESVKKRDAEIRGYIAGTKTIPEASKVAVLEKPRQALELIDPAQNSIGYLYVLDLVFNSTSALGKIDKRMLLDKIVRFFTHFDPVQIRYVGATFRSLLDRVATGPMFPPAVTVELLTAVILRIDPTGTVFTSTHLQLAKMAVESNVVEPALEVLDKEVTWYPVMSSSREAREARDSRPLCDTSMGPAGYISTATGLTDGFKSVAVLEYNYFRSLVYSRRRDWGKAFSALQQVITHPAKERGVSKVMVECHKRWLLVGLLKYGKAPSLPAYTSSQPKATYNSLSADYSELAILFTTPQAAELKRRAELGGELWQEDGTTSLVAEVLSAYQKWQIINLRKIFTEVSISQVRQLTCSAQTGELLKTDEDVIELVQGMLSSGMLNGTLEVDGSAGSFLKFGNASSVMTEEQFAREIATSHARITTLNKQYKDVNDRLSEKKEYVKWLFLEQKRAEKEGPDAGVGFDSQIEDEDLMTGIMAHACFPEIYHSHIDASKPNSQSSYILTVTMSGRLSQPPNLVTPFLFFSYFISLSSSPNFQLFSTFQLNLKLLTPLSHSKPTNRRIKRYPAQSFAFKALAATAVGLPSLVGCVPVTVPSHTTTRCGYPLGLCGRDATPSSTTSLETVTWPTPVTGVAPVPLASGNIDAAAEDGNAEGAARDDLDYVAGLFGLTSSQMSKLSMETSDPALEESPDGVVPSEADLELAKGIIHAHSSIDRRDDTFDKRPDEIKTQEKLKKSQDKTGFWLGIVNATPYRWKLLGIVNGGVIITSTRQFTRYIEPGNDFTVELATWNDDSYAEIRYRLIGTSEKTWFSIKIHPGYPHRITAEYGGVLETVGYGDEGKRGSVVDLGVGRGVYVATYVLAGAEGRFYDNNAPPNWMNSMMGEIGNSTLRDIMLPRSHHTGMYTLRKTYGFGSRSNTLTQDFNVYDQLKVGGVRVVDCRPLIGKDGKIYEGHGTKLLGMYHGSSGVSHESMIQQINQFNDDYPGELIIIDVDGNEMRSEKGFNQISGGDVAKLVDSFKTLKHRANITAGQDISMLPLNELLSQGKSQVVIRMEEYRVRELFGNGWPGASEGFITPVELPLNKFFSEEQNATHLNEVHLQAIFRNRKSGNKKWVFESDYIIIQQGLDLIQSERAITKISDSAWLSLLQSLWPSFYHTVYPNWLSMDAVRGTALKGIALAVNQCFAAQRCGNFRGRIPAADPFILNSTTAGNTTSGTIDNDALEHKVVHGKFVNATAVETADN
ncbi:hypothetical protein NLG97_g5497 [Lecanicillium saksenae]|uniref:Uncharacterized protein n=1 Tax=Lecanicillium saksenae TaxID=468837 RepID=A0ACC1QUQ2_9HYPO|nr:hypothetical protein NLG97_g5497 [Lecanicillium saksenae]